MTNFAGNAIATVVIGKWTNNFDKAQADRVLSGLDPFDYSALGFEEPDVKPGEIPEVTDEVSELSSVTPYPVVSDTQ